MLSFVEYFSTAQEELGYIVKNDFGKALANGLRGPELPHGVYRVQDGALVLIELHSAEPKPQVDVWG